MNSDIILDHTTAYEYVRYPLLRDTLENWLCQDALEIIAAYDKIFTTKPCSTCGKTPQPHQPFDVCARCKCTQYCSRVCQAEHWKSEHKHFCRLNVGDGVNSTMAKRMKKAFEQHLTEEAFLKLTHFLNADTRLAFIYTGAQECNMKRLGTLMNGAVLALPVPTDRRNKSREMKAEYQEMLCILEKRSRLNENASIKYWLTFTSTIGKDLREPVPVLSMQVYFAKLNAFRILPSLTQLFHRLDAIGFVSND